MLTSRTLRSALLVATALVPFSASHAQMRAVSAGDNKLTPAEKAAGWILLFDGRTMTGWRAYKTDVITGWAVVNGTLTKEKSGPGDIVTKDQYGNFELTFDWKIGAGGNSGVFVRATEQYDKIYWSATEYQLLDDAGHSDGKNPLTSAGSAYGLYPAAPGIVKPAGEWNSSKIVVHGKHYEHWLNGVMLLQYEMLSPDWLAKVKASKFKDYADYGLATKGYIGIQGDHPGSLALRNIKLLPN